MKRLIILFSALLLSLPALCSAQEMVMPYLRLPKTFFTHPNPLAAEWQQVPASIVPLFPQNVTAPARQTSSIAQMKARALHNGKWMAVLVSWDDPTRDVHVETDLATDAVAIQFPIKAPDQTSPFMGSKGAMVSILHWKGIWQQDIDAHYQQVKDLYPNTWVDTYQFGIEGAVDVKNPIAQPTRKTPVEELIAEGFGSLTTQRHQNSLGRGVWKDGAWHVMFVRELKTGDAQDTAFSPGATSAIAFAAWQGSTEDVGARKNYAPWMALRVEEKK